MSPYKRSKKKKSALRDNGLIVSRGMKLFSTIIVKQSRVEEEKSPEMVRAEIYEVAGEWSSNIDPDATPDIHVSESVINTSAMKFREFLFAANSAQDADRTHTLEQAGDFLKFQGSILFTSISKIKVEAVALSVGFVAQMEGFSPKFCEEFLEAISGKPVRKNANPHLIILQTMFPAPTGSERRAFQKRISALGLAAAWCGRNYEPGEIAYQASIPGGGLDAWMRLEGDKKRLEANEPKPLLQREDVETNGFDQEQLNRLRMAVLKAGALSIDTTGFEAIETSVDGVIWFGVADNGDEAIIKDCRFLNIKDPDVAIIKKVLDQLTERIG